MTKMMKKTITHYPQSGRYKVKHWRQNHKALIKHPKGKQVIKLAEEIEQTLNPFAKKLTIVGSIRRKKEPNDIDIVMIAKDKDRVKEAIEKQGKIESAGNEQIFAKIKNVPVDIFFSDRENYGAQLLTRTGPQGANISNRELAKSKGLKLSQYGLFKGEKKIAGETERSIYQALGKTYREPEQRGLPR